MNTFELKTQQEEIMKFRDSLSLSLRERVRQIVFDKAWRGSYLIIFVYLQQLRMKTSYEDKVKRQATSEIMLVESA